MDIRKIIMALLMVVLGAGSAAAHPVSVPRLYVFGFAASFNDSTVYITEVQTVDSAWIESNGGFLYNRGEYANQLRTYLKSIGKADETCPEQDCKKPDAFRLPVNETDDEGENHERGHYRHNVAENVNDHSSVHGVTPVCLLYREARCS